MTEILNRKIYQTKRKRSTRRINSDFYFVAGKRKQRVGYRQPDKLSSVRRRKKLGSEGRWWTQSSNLLRIFIIAAVYEDRSFHIRDFVLSFLQEEVKEEEEGGPLGSGCL